MVEIVGIDFGTTNSLVSLALDDRVLSLVEEDRPHPSVVWYSGAEVVVGRKARQHLEALGAPIIGDAVRSPKMFLGMGRPIHVGGVERDARDVVKEIFLHLRNHARSQRQYRSLSLDRAIMTIPVNRDGRYRRELRDAAQRAGIGIVQFVHEPLAALYGYLRGRSDFRRLVSELERKLVLVFDWGGGTLDLTLCTLRGGTLVQIQNKGNDTVGGDRFDEVVLNHLKEEHAVRHRLSVWPDEMPGAMAKLVTQAENAKINLSTKTRPEQILVPNFLAADGPVRTLETSLARSTLEELTHDLVLRGINNIDELLHSAGVHPQSIALCLATGGMVRMPYIRDRLIERFGPARVPLIDKGDRIIAEGAAWIAHDGVRLRLAKPFELLHADDSYVTVIPAGTELPMVDQDIRRLIDMYCVDPQDGCAKFQFARPTWPGRHQPSDPRKIYANLTIKVDHTAPPLRERLKGEIVIDHDLVANVKASSTLVGDEQSTEIHDLEFGISTPSAAAEDGNAHDTDQNSGSGIRGALRELPGTRAGGEIRLRPNVTSDSDAWQLVPGDIVTNYRPNHFDKRNSEVPAKQRDEQTYYARCSICHRTIMEIKLQGCPNPRCSAAEPLHQR